MSFFADPTPPPSFKRENRHDCHCGDQHLPDRDGSCQLCGRFPRSLIAKLNEERKRRRARRAER